MQKIIMGYFIQVSIYKEGYIIKYFYIKCKITIIIHIVNEKIIRLI